MDGYGMNGWVVEWKVDVWVGGGWVGGLVD